jgi:hypothetical protein
MALLLLLLLLPGMHAVASTSVADATRAAAVQHAMHGGKLGPANCIAWQPLRSITCGRQLVGAAIMQHLYSAVMTFSSARHYLAGAPATDSS